jgi:dihydropteroate synthase
MKLIYFNAPSKPENMGISQLVDDINQFIAERSEELPNAQVAGNIIQFDGGYAVFVDVPSDFQN